MCVKMPIVRKILKHGDSKAITLPASWLKAAEEKAGKRIIAVALEVNGAIKLKPVFEKEATQ
jgi:antitoxin component of MazEF toxin-antitoxin module